MSREDPDRHGPTDAELVGLRTEYDLGGLEPADLAGSWHEQLERWTSDAVAAGLPDPTAMVLATVGADGTPATRTVLCRGVDERGVVFYTNHRSRKGRHLAATGRAAATFPWLALQRQCTVIGAVEQLEDTESDAYFASRPRGSQLGAWASAQSEPINDRSALDEQLAAVSAEFGGIVPRPPHWGGFRIRPREVEFWHGRPSRLHDRLRFRQVDEAAPDGTWVVERLQP